MLPDKQSYEVVDAVELAQRWRVPVSWIREQTRDRATDPCLAFAWTLRPLRVGQPQVNLMVGQTADTMNRIDDANSALSAEVLAILSLSPLTSNVASRMIRNMTAKKNPNAVALGKLGGEARAASLSAKERSESARKQERREAKSYRLPSGPASQNWQCKPVNANARLKERTIEVRRKRQQTRILSPGTRSLVRALFRRSSNRRNSAARPHSEADSVPLPHAVNVPPKASKRRPRRS